MNLYTVQEVAKILKTTKQTIYKLKDNGQLKFIKIGTWKCPEEELKKFIADNTGKNVI